MGIRDDTMQTFGPFLIEAIALIVLDELNILRAQAGLPPRTVAQLLTAVNTTVAGLTDYDWMD